VRVNESEEPFPSLDPDNWDGFRQLAHRMVDDMIDHLSHIADRPAWVAPPAAVVARLSQPLPRQGEGAEAAYKEFVDSVLPYPNGNLHPRFFGWAQSNGTLLGMMADMLASGLNPYLGGFNQAPALVEDQVIAWLVEMMGYPSDSSGLLTLGGSMSNLLALVIARYAALGPDVRDGGVVGLPQRPMLYTSVETHRCVAKAADVLGFGAQSLRLIGVDAEYRLDLPELRRAIAEDRAAGLMPICVIGSAGTTNTGSIDDLDAIGALCRDEKLWFHVDAAWAGLGRLSPLLADRLSGIEQSDSVSVNLHKWLYQPVDVAALLVRDAKLHRATFAGTPAYFEPGGRGVSAGGFRFADLGLDTTRSFRALKVWLSLKAEGADKFAAIIERNVSQATYLAKLIDCSPYLELTAPVPLNVVCFRYHVPDMASEALDFLNQELLLRLEESGDAVLSSTRLNGRFVLRCAILNHRTRQSDLDLVAKRVIEIGNDLCSQQAAADDRLQ
jgi:aromatic-L-amino-acid/L-tryptophan decarboxylase